jgi:hypothetical protein
VAEGISSKIMAIERRVGGYRNRQNFIFAIFFYCILFNCGGLDLYPRGTPTDPLSIGILQYSD